MASAISLVAIAPVDVDEEQVIELNENYGVLSPVLNMPIRN